MKDSDPRPMPPEVQRAYRDPLNLTDLLSSPVFTDRDRLSVRDELLDRLVRKHGNVEVEIGKGNRTLPIRKRVAQFKKNAWGSIEVMIASEELGGSESVMLELASVMQPYWLRWWEEMDWDGYKSLQVSMDISEKVLGRRQLTWLAAQYARSVVDISSDRQTCLAAISAAETWAVVPSKENLDRSTEAASAAYDAVRAASAVYAAAGAAAFAARAAAFAADRAAAAAAYAAASAAYAAYVSYVSYGASYSRLRELTKRLITPTLITSASRGLR